MYPSPGKRDKYRKKGREGMKEREEASKEHKKGVWEGKKDERIGRGHEERKQERKQESKKKKYKERRVKGKRHTHQINKRIQKAELPSSSNPAVYPSSLIRITRGGLAQKHSMTTSFPS